MYAYTVLNFQKYLLENPSLTKNLYENKDTAGIIHVVKDIFRGLDYNIFDEDYRTDWKTQTYIDALKKVYLMHML